MSYNRFTGPKTRHTVKRSGAKQEASAAKAVMSMVSAGCPADVAAKIAANMPDGSTGDIRGHITAELLRRGETEAAACYGSYRAGFSPQALHILQAGYLLRHGDRTETPTELFGRVAICMAMPMLGDAEPPHDIHGFGVNPHHLIAHSLAGRPRAGGRGVRRFLDAVKSYHNMMASRRFLPNPPTLMNAGAPSGQLSACFVLDMPDIRAGVMDTMRDAALIFRGGGGVGINYSNLRPAGAPVGSAAGTAAGPIHFMGLVDIVGDAVKQGGRRRAANMGVLDAWHPDILDFVRARRDGHILNDFISVGLDAEFWEAFESGRKYRGRSAAALLDELAWSAHTGAGPGVIFFDNVNRHNVLAKARGGPLRSTDPCWSGETRILTKDGPVSFRELAGGPSKVRVMTREEDGTLSYRTMENPGMTKQGAEVVCLVVESRQTGECAALRCTPDHRVYAVSASGVERRAVADLTPGTSLASLYLDGSVWEQTVGVSASVSDIPERAMQGTGHPTPGILPLSLAAKRGRQKKRQAAAEGFVAANGSVPEVQSAKKSGLLSRLLGRNRNGNRGGNHTVLAVIHIGRTDVYNGMVETTHNYFVECGEGHYILSGNCGGQALYPNESCILGSINLAEYVDDGRLDWDTLAEETRLCTRMLDGVADMTRHPTVAIEKASNETRRIGLGVMGVADMLAYMGIPYNSAEAYGLFGRLAEHISYHSMSESVKMAAESGPFPLYEKSAYAEGRLPFAGYSEPYRAWEHRHTQDWAGLLAGIKRHGIRNALTTAIAPAGMISVLAGCSSGIEPAFPPACTKTAPPGEFRGSCPAPAAGVAAACDAVPESGDDADVFAAARRIHWADHILAQAAWQRWTGNSVSKTVSMAASATMRDVRDAYMLAHSLGCRGLAIRRDDPRRMPEDGAAAEYPEPSDAAAGCL